MPEFVLTYHGGNFDMSPEEGEKHRAQHMEWIAALGNAVVNPGLPFGPTKMVSKNSVADEHPVTGITIIKADNLGEAVKIAQKAPYLDIDGKIGVSEAMSMG